MVRTAVRNGLSTVGLAFLYATVLACAGAPAAISAQGFSYPKPKGGFPVGTRYFLFEDPSRPDPYSENSDDYRWISVKMWYPAAPFSDARPAQFGVDEFDREMVEERFFDSTYLSEVSTQPSASFQDASFAANDAPWPILIFSSSGVMTANVFLSEELASHGYVVVAVGHPYWSEFYFDQQGEVFRFDKSNRYYTAMWREEDAAPTKQIKEQITRSTDWEEKLELYERLNQLTPNAVADLVLWQEDIGFLIDQLYRLSNEEGPYRDRLDTERIGILGYSKGGALAAQVSATTDWVRAGANLDGFAPGGSVENDLRVPFMNISQIEPWCSGCLPLNLHFLETSASDVYLLQIDGANHATFTDLPLLRDYIIRDGIVTPLAGETSAEIISSYLLGFFDTYVKGHPISPILNEIPSSFREVNFMKRTRF